MSLNSQTTHKALAAPSKGGDLAVIDIPTYTPGPEEVLVKVHAAALNPGDWKLHKRHDASSYPAIFGFDIAGEVIQIGDAVEKFVIGDKIVAQTDGLENRFSGFQQFAVKDTRTASKIPDNLTYDEASTLPAVINTALTGLYAEFPHGAGLVPPYTPEGINKYQGDPIVILGGASSVGQAVIQVAKLSGFSPIIVTASESHTGYLKSLGATHVISRHLDAAATKSAIQSIVGEKQVKTVYDAITVKDTMALGYSLVAEGGVLIVLLGIGGEPEKTSTKTANVFAFLSLPSNIELYRRAYRDHVFGWLKDGHIKPNGVEVLPNGLKGIPDGLRRLENNQVSATKLVTHPQETV